MWQGAQGQRGAWHGTGVTSDSEGGGSNPAQGIGCFPSLMASATVETPVTRLLAGTGCPLRPPNLFLQLHSLPLYDSGPSWSLSQLGVESRSGSSNGSRVLSGPAQGQKAPLQWWLGHPGRWTALGLVETVWKALLHFRAHAGLNMQLKAGPTSAVISPGMRDICRQQWASLNLPFSCL